MRGPRLSDPPSRASEDDMAKTDVCAIEGCGKPARKRRLCWMHHKRLQVHGDPLQARRSPCHEWLQEHVRHSGEPCLIWPFSRNKIGYARAHYPGSRIETLASRIMCEMVNGPPPSDGYQAAHSCGRGRDGCVHPKHLRWATVSENAREAFVHGTNGYGTKAHSAKLTKRQVVEIRKRANTVSHSDLAREFGVSRMTVTNAARGVYYKEVEP